MLAIQEIGRHLVAGFDGTTWSEHLQELLKLGVGGVILFSRNFESPEQLADLVRQIRQHSPQRIFIGVDQEGGRVARLGTPFTAWPPMAHLGTTADTTLADRFGEALACELRAVGIDWVFAPVMDVASNPDNTVIGDRSFGDNPDRVTQFGVTVLCALQRAGVMACAKHFPGHGGTLEDSHETLPVLLASDATLCDRDLVPFVAAVDAGVGSIMTAHVIFAVWDLAHPASVSRVLIEGRLRRSIGYDGLVVSDDLEMAAVANRYEPANLALLAFHAGNDFLMACHTFDVQEGIVRTLYDARMANMLSGEMFTQSQKRMTRAAERFVAPPPGDLTVIGCQEHRALADQIEQQALASAD